MKKIGRPRKAVTKKNISVNLPSHLVDQINDKLSWQSSRSNWIESAIKEKLTQEIDLHLISSHMMLKHLFARGIISDGLFTQLMTQVEETVEEQ